MNYNLILSLVFFTNLAFSQSGTIIGLVKDKQDHPIPYATVTLLLSKDSTIIKGNMTDDNGIFAFNNVQENEYIVSVSQIGMRKNYSQKFIINKTVSEKKLGTITLDDEAATLSEVTITSKTPTFERKPDRTIVNVSSDLTSGSSTAMDILEKSPGVTVDKDGKISMNGKSGVMIMIDDKPTHLSGEQLSTLLSGMSAEQINQIELITNPSAKYDAEGTAGIINIKLKKSKMYGANGSISLTTSQGVYNRSNSNLNLNLRNEKLNLFGNYDANRREMFSNIVLKRNFRKGEELTSVFDQTTRLKNNTSGHSVKTGIDYFINNNNTIGFVFNGSFNPQTRSGSNYTTIFDGYSKIQSIINAENRNNVKFGDYSFNLNYESKLDTNGSKLNFDADFAKFLYQDHAHSIYSNYDSLSTLSSINALKYYTASDINIGSIKADFTKPLAKGWKLESGVKISFVHTDNNVLYHILEGEQEIPDTSRSNHFKYSENIIAAYSMVSKSWNKITIQTGLRGEQTLNKGYQQNNDSSFTRSYFKLFPTASISYNPSANHQWGLSYSRRIDRPDYQDMNPFRFYLDQYTYEQGNPFLRPQFSNNFELSYTFKHALSGMFAYSRTRDIITGITRQNDSTHVTYMHQENLDINDNYSLSLSLPVPIAQWLTSNNSLTANYSYFDSQFAGALLKVGKMNYSFNSSNQLQLKHNLSLQVDLRYNSPEQFAIFYIKSSYGVSLSIQKKILHEKGKIKLSAQNIIRNKYTSVDANFQNMDFSIRQRRDNQFISISFSYSFGKTNLAASRKHVTGAEEEKSRIKRD